MRIYRRWVILRPGVLQEVERLAFFDFPPEHWDHLRTTNPIEREVAPVV